MSTSMSIDLISAARSPFRPIDSRMPELTVKLTNNPRSYTIRDSHIEAYPTFGFSEQDFTQDVLPPNEITPVNPQDPMITGLELQKLIQKLITQVRARKREFTDFYVIQRKNFNNRRRSGLLVLKAKKYPYVIKLFMENPKTFTHPFGKGIEPITFFYMAGGSNRHLSGLTRIKNRNYVQQKLEAMPEWKGLIYMPRKWMWIPKNEPWLDIRGKNIGDTCIQHTQLPSVYVIVADAIDTQDCIRMQSKKKMKLIMKLCNDVDLFIDPHINNYIFQPAPTRTGYRIAIVDTEHFPTMAGFKEKVYCKTHLVWYATLIRKCLHDMYFRGK
jgi:hypothetical protein